MLNIKLEWEDVYLSTEAGKGGAASLAGCECTHAFLPLELTN